jgi:hypothetical protein
LWSKTAQAIDFYEKAEEELKERGLLWK